MPIDLRHTSHRKSRARLLLVGTISIIADDTLAQQLRHMYATSISMIQSTFWYVACDAPSMTCSTVKAKLGQSSTSSSLWKSDMVRISMQYGRNCGWEHCGMPHNCHTTHPTPAKSVVACFTTATMQHHRAILGTFSCTMLQQLAPERGAMFNVIMKTNAHFGNSLSPFISYFII